MKEERGSRREGGWGKEGERRKENGGWRRLKGEHGKGVGGEKNRRRGGSKEDRVRDQQKRRRERRGGGRGGRGRRGGRGGRREEEESIPGSLQRGRERP
jgi:hypothetical protein